MYSNSCVAFHSVHKLHDMRTFMCAKCFRTKVGIHLKQWFNSSCSVSCLIFQVERSHGLCKRMLSVSYFDITYCVYIHFFFYLTNWLPCPVSWFIILIQFTQLTTHTDSRVVACSDKWFLSDKIRTLYVSTYWSTEDKKLLFYGAHIMILYSETVIAHSESKARVYQ